MVLPVAASHSRAVWSWDPVRTRLPSPLNATDVIQWVCPVKVLMVLPLADVHSRRYHVP